MEIANSAHPPATAQIRDARDLLTRLYGEIGISAVAAALEVRKDKPRPAHPAIAVLQDPSRDSGQPRAA